RGGRPQADAGMPHLRARWLRDQMDRRARLPDDPGPHARRVPPHAGVPPLRLFRARPRREYDMSGKTARKQAPTRVPPPPGPRPPARRALTKVVVAVGALVAAVVVGIVVVVSLSGGSSTPSAPAVGSLTNALPGAASVQALFKGIPQSSNTLGAPNAPVT